MTVAPDPKKRSKIFASWFLLATFWIVFSAAVVFIYLGTNEAGNHPTGFAYMFDGLPHLLLGGICLTFALPLLIVTLVIATKLNSDGVKSGVLIVLLLMFALVMGLFALWYFA
ncbi:MAG: hypothetical protein VX527_11175 [Planctomycetota bacterium]|nr:hypothetical protein [Planctomycetota bacterium]